MKRILFFAGLLTVNVLFAQTSSVTYRVKSGDDLSKIARTHHISLSQLQAANPQLKGTTIKVGEAIEIPSSSADANSSSPSAMNGSTQPVIHIVEKGETLSSISRSYHVKIGDLQSWNHLSGNDIKVGQRLIVSNSSRVSAVIKTSNEQPQNVLKTDTNTKKIAINFDSIRQQRQTIADTSHITYSTDISSDKLHGSVQKGIATWTKDQNDGGNYYALSSDAPVGTMVIVKNLMNDKTIRVKVIGKLPDADKSENAIIKISYSAAQGMNVLDDRFLVQLIYPVNN